MIWLLIILGLLLTFLIFLLLTPLVLVIDTEKAEYSLTYRGVGGVNLIPDAEELIFLRYRIFFLKVIFIPLEQKDL